MRAGFALPTVVILLALIATSVFLVTREATTGGDRVNRTEDAAAARYAARAGLAHATWVANASACASYDLPATAFGPHSYAAAFTPTANSPVAIVAVGTSADGASASVTRQSVRVYDATQQSLTLQPSASEGKDAWIGEGSSDENNGGDAVLKVKLGAERSLIEFDLSRFPSQGRLLDAKLELYVVDVSKSGEVGLYRGLRSWTEGACVGAVCAAGVTWDTRDGLSPWAKPGGDFDGDHVASATVGAPDIGTRAGFDVSAIVADWLAGVDNRGVFLIAQSDAEMVFQSSDGAAGNHPRLVLNFVCECGAVCEAGAAKLRNVLLVAGDKANLTPEQADKKALMEGWGHAITLIETSESQAAFDAAAALVDVVYVPELGATPMSELGTKADGLAGGVITEEARRALKMGDFALFPFVDSATIEVTDNSHYITEMLPLGTVTLSTSVQSMWVLKPTLAADLHVLAELGSAQPGLAYVEEGELLNDGAPAPGRRVKLPWGAYEFDINDFTEDARLLMQRAIEWGATSPDKSPFAHWQLDDGAGPTALDSEGDNDGTLVGSPAWVAGTLDGALHLDGLDDYVDAGSFDVSGSGLTLLGWFNADTIPTSDGRIVSKASGPNEADAWWQLSTTDVGADRYLRMRIKAGGTTTTFADSTVKLTTGRWYFAVATYRNGSGEMKLYLDGVEVASGTHAVGGPVDTNPGVPVAIGANGTAERFFDGVLDDVRVYDRALGAGEIADLYGMDPVAHWKLDDGAGPTALDSEGDNDGTLVGEPSWVAGQIGAALHFDGTDDYVDAGTFDVSGSGLTLLGWFNADTIPTSDGRIVSKASGPNEADAWWQLSTTDVGANRYLRMRIKAGGTTTTFADATVNLTTAQWYFGVATYDNTSADMRLYLDGVEVASGSHAVGGPVDTDPSVAVAIGANGTAERFFDGVLDDVRVYNRALGPIEISDLYDAGGGGGGGGGPDCAATVADDFETDDYTGGTGPWNWNWEEYHESNGASLGDEQVVLVDGAYAVRVQDNDNGGEGVLRGADLSGWASAEVILHYRRNGLDDADDFVSIEVSDDGGSVWTPVLKLEGPGTDTAWQTATHDISDFINADFRVRMITSSFMGPNDRVYFDDVEICLN